MKQLIDKEYENFYGQKIMKIFKKMIFVNLKFNLRFNN